MFGNTKPFGTASTFGTGTFGSTSTPFGQNSSTFGAKPATGNVFGATAFGSTATNTGGLFGSTTPATGLFGQTSTAFGQPASTSGGSFGFGSTSTTGGLFGTTTQPTQSSGGLFGSTNTSAFGSPRPAFGSFGSNTTGTGLFGQSTSTGTGLFGSSGGFGSTPTNGTTVKFNPPTGSDTMMKNGISTNISTRHQCITCMKEYENKSLEELRLEDYLANRKGPQGGGIGGFGAPTGQTGLFGAPAASTSAFSFGTTQAKPLFGSTGTTNTFGTTGTSLFGQTTQTPNASIFGKPVGFGTPTTSATPAFNFSATSGAPLFGQNQQKPLFGQNTSGTGLFGSTATTQASTGFGTGTGFGSFGTGTQTSNSLFGAKPSVFGNTNATTASTFSFGNPTLTGSGGGLFGQKTAAPSFGTSTGFGTQPTGFGGFNTAPTSTTGLFGQTKPNTSFMGGSNTFGSGLGAGFGTGSSFSSLGMNTGANTNLFGGSLANKPSGLTFGPGSTGFGFGQNNPGSTFAFGQNGAAGMGSDQNAMNALLQQQLQTQQILALTASPYGDNPLFRNTIKGNKKREEEVLKPTNQAAQKALLTTNQYKVSPLPCPKIKPKPVTPIPDGKMSLFDGLEDEEPSLGNTTFVPKRSVKKLVIKQNNNTPSFTVTSNISTGNNRSAEINFSASIHLRKSPNKSPSQHNSNSPEVAPLTVNNSEGVLNASPNISSLISNDILHDGSYISDNIPDVNAKNLKNNDLHIRGPKNLEKDSNLTSSPISRVQDDLCIRSPKEADNVICRACKSDSRARDDTQIKMPNNFERTLSCHDDSDDKIYFIRGSHSSSCDSPNLGDGNENAAVPCKQKSTHPTGIILNRSEYYTDPSLDEMVSLIDESGNCFVENFTVGREGYGKVCFPGLTNVANLNLDEIVHFRRKEITIYPDDNNKPPVGEELNRKAEITLDCVWPTDKTTRSSIKDPDRLALMGYREKIEKSTAKFGATFIDYKPETGSWIFQVSHFSKYGLEDSDDECDDPKLVQDAKLKLQAQQKKAQLSNEDSKLPDTLLSHVPLNKKMKASDTDGDDEMKDINLTSVKELEQMEEDENFYSPIQKLVVAGVDAARIQGMKASFFQDEMDYNWVTPNGDVMNTVPEFSHMKIVDFLEPISFKEPLIERTQKMNVKKSFSTGSQPAELQFSSSPFSGLDSSKFKTSVASPKPEKLLPYPVLSTVSVPPELGPVENKISGASRKIVLKPFEKSLCYSKQKLIANTGYLMGRSSRVGWGPRWTFLQTGHTDSEEKEGLQKSSVFGDLLTAAKIPQDSNALSVSICTIQFSPYAPYNDDYIRKSLDESLSLQLQHSTSAIENGAPVFVPKPGTNLLNAHCKLSHSQFFEMDPRHCDYSFMKQCNEVWELCVALWGEISDSEYEVGNSDYFEQMMRRETLSRWLIKTMEEEIHSEISDNSYNTDAYLYAIFSHLSGQQISKAVFLSQENNDNAMSTLLAEAEGNMVVRGLISKQLMNWEYHEAYKFISRQRLKIYALLAGIMLWKTPLFVVNCCENLNWRRSLAIHLWYHCHPNSSIQEAVMEYEKAFQNEESSYRYARPPYAPYILNGNDVAFNTVDTKDIGTAFYDTCYHLLKLYCDRSHRMDKLLMPETSTPAHLDHRLSWLLFQALTAIGYDHLPEYSACSLHCNFAAQLEAMGMWHWAIFVMLHLPDADRRAKCVKEILLRHVSTSQELTNNTKCEERETFLHEQLLVPKEWIFEAKAIKAHSFGHTADEAWYLLKAGRWNQSHEIVVTQLASDAIINENYDYLLSFLTELSLPERSSTILGWSSGGQVFLDYIHVSQMVEKVIKGDVSAYDVEKLHPEVLSLCHRLSSIRCLSSKGRLCQSEMAKKTATLLRAILTLQAEKSGTSTEIYMLAPHIKNLPMPEDYILQELQAMTHNYMIAVASE